MIIKLKSLLLKEYWEPTDNDILSIAELNIPADDDYQPSPGEHLQRVVWDIKKGQDINTHKLSYIGLRGEDNKGIYGIHISGDTDYWINRLEQDYDRDSREAKIIEIIANEGDMLVEDP